MASNPRGDEVIRVTIACGVLEATAVILRFVARWKTEARYAADDWMMLLTLIPSYGMLLAGWYSQSQPASTVIETAVTDFNPVITRGQGGLHANQLTREQLVVFLKVSRISPHSSSLPSQPPTTS